MEYPTFLYRCPGPHFGPQWTTYGTRDVVSADDAAAAVADGWFWTLQEAAEDFLVKRDAAGAASTAKTLAAINPPAPEPVAAVADDAPPTREEMLEQAARIGLKVDRRWGDETLLAAIIKHMKQQEASA
jgi:hypothetical protein